MKDDSLISKVNTSFGKFTLDWFDFWNWQFSDFFSDLKILLIFNFLQTFNYKSKIVVSFELCSRKVHSLTNSPRVPIECYHYLILSPKGEFLRTSRGVPLLECFITLPPKGEFLWTPRGVPLFGNAFSCLFRKSIFPPLRPIPKLGGWLVGWVGVLPFGTLDHVRTIFFKFLVL